ncbi:MAG TPA: CheR family methyltransferase [Kofleriaceae bacterium]|nr:CheR family methyltransferase [Kofleriaceae bacterium]
MSRDAAAEIADLLGRHIGLDPTSIGELAVGAAIRARAQAAGAADEVAYLALLRGRPAELAALVEEIVVPETWFLRDRVPFANLAAHATATRAARGEVPLRVLSVPCSTGEEPYSIAIALLDAGLGTPQFHIDAVDVSRRVLAIAARATYGAASFRGDDLGFRARWFRPQGNEWELLPEARASVFFEPGNLLDRGFADRRARYHVVFCRNLLIYLTPEARADALSRLEGLLEPGGLFVAGHAEALQVMDRRFRPVELPGAFTYVRAADVRARRATVVPPSPPARPLDLPPARDTSQMHAFPTRNIPRRPPPAAPTPTPTPTPRDLLAEAAALANRGDLAAAAALCDEHLRAVPDAPGYALLGTIRQADGRLEDAEAMFSRALYCDPGHYESLVHLALLRERRGDRAGAEQFKRRAAKARARGGNP